MQGSASSIGSSVGSSRARVREVAREEPHSGPWFFLLAPVSLALTIGVVVYVSLLSF